MARPSAEGGFLMICQFCEYEFPDGLGKYGCPNCHGEGLDEDIDIKDQISDEDQDDR